MSDQADYAPGSQVTITGSGWPANDLLKVFTNDSVGQTWSDTGYPQTDANGDFVYTLTLPNWFVATYTTVASDTSGLSATTTFTDASISVSPDWGPSGTSVTVSGSGYAHSSNVTISVDGSDVTTCTTTSSGAISSGCTITVSGSAGDHTVTATDPSATSKSTTFSVIALALSPTHGTAGTSVSASGDGFRKNQTITFTFDGNALATSACTADSNGSFSGCTFTVPSISAGSYTVAAADGTGGSARTASTSFTVDPSVTATAISAVSGSGTYGGTATLTATLKAGATALSGKTISFTLNGSSVGTAPTDGSGVAELSGVSLSGYDAGTYASYVGASFAGDSGYGASSGSGDLTVSRADPDCSSVSGYSVTFDGNAHTASGSCTGVGGPSDVLSGLDLTGTTHTNAGDYPNDPWSFAQTTNYNAAGGSVHDQIDRRPVTASIVAENKVYDGTAAATVSSCSLEPATDGHGVVGSDDVNCTASNASFGTATAGAGKTVTADVSLMGMDKDNYELTSASASTTADVTKRPVTASITAENKVYDGTAAATVSSCSLEPATDGHGVVGSDDVNCTAGNASFGTAAPGAGKTVTADVSLTGSAAGNYALTSSTVSTTASIKMRANDDSLAVQANSAGNTLGVLVNDDGPSPTDPAPHLAVTSVDTGGTKGTVTIAPDGSNVTYTPASNYIGPDSFKYTIDDGAGGTSTAMVSLDVQVSGTIDTVGLLEDASLNDLKGEYDVVFAKSPKPYDKTLQRLKNTDPGELHLRVQIWNDTNVDVNTGNGNSVAAIFTIPGMPASCGSGVKPVHGLNFSGSDGTAYTADGDCTNPGGLGQPAFVLKGGGDGKDSVHAHPDDKTDDQQVTVQYKASGPCSDPAGYSSTLPSDGVARCVMVTGFAIKRAGDGPHGVKHGHGTTIEIKLRFRPIDTDWAGNPTLYFHAGFNFQVSKLITFGAGTPDAQSFNSVDNLPVVGVGKRVTAVGGLVLENRNGANPGNPATGYTVRLFNSAGDAGVSTAQPFGDCSTGSPVAVGNVDSDGFYFVWKAGGPDASVQDSGSGPDLPSGVTYYVQVCDPSNNAVGRSLANKLGDKEFDEQDFTDFTSPRPLSLVIAHHDGKPSNNDTVVVQYSEPLVESSLCSAWGTDNTKDQTLSGVDVQIQNDAASSGNDKLVVSGNPCGGSAFHFGSADLGSPGYVTVDTDYPTSKIQWNHNGTLTITLGGPTAGQVTSALTATYTPDSALTDLGGNTIVGTAKDTTTGSKDSNF